MEKMFTTESLFDFPPASNPTEPIPPSDTTSATHQSAPAQFVKYEQAFDKFAAAQVAIQDVWDLGANDAVLSPAMMAPKPLSVFMTPQEAPADCYISPNELISSTSSTVRSNFSDLDYSPMYDNLDVTEAPNWDPLFPDAPAADTEEASSAIDLSSVEPQQQQSIGHAPVSEPLSASASPALSTASLSSPSLSQRRRSSSPKSSLRRGPNGNRVDDMGITIYSRKPRTMPLRPVEIPETADNATAKRARNTEAARRSRARKLERMAQLEDRVKQLVERNEQLEAEVQRLKALAGES